MQNDCSKFVSAFALVAAERASRVAGRMSAALRIGSVLSSVGQECHDAASVEVLIKFVLVLEVPA